MAVTLPSRTIRSDARKGAGARIPGAMNVPQVATPVDPGLRTSPEQFGALEGAALETYEGASLAGASAVDRAVSRKETTQINQNYVAHNQILQEELSRIDSEEDLSNEEVVKKYRDFVNQQTAATVAAADMRPGPRARLNNELNSLNDRYIGQVSGMSAAYQIKNNVAAMDARAGPVIQSAYSDPGNLSDQYTQIDQMVEASAPSLPGPTEPVRKYYRSQVAMNHVQGLLDLGALDEAEKSLNQPDIADNLSSGDATKLRRSITVQKVESERAMRETQARLTAIEKFVGPMSRTEKLAAMGVRLPQGSTKETLADKIRVFEAVKTERMRARGELKPDEQYIATGDEIDEIAGLDVGNESNMFGAGVQGKALQYITEGADAFATGLMTPEQENIFMSAVTEYTQPRMVPNPDTGLMETVRPELPPFVIQALQDRQARGTTLAQAASAPPQPVTSVVPTLTAAAGATPPMTATERPASSAGAVSSSGAGAPAGTSAPAGGPPATETRPPAGQPTEVAGRPTTTIWDEASNITGPWPKVMETLGQTPGIGRFMPAQQFAMARQRVTQAQTQLTTILQNSPRYAEGEREQIRESINIESKLWDDPPAFQDRLMGIDEALAEREQYASDVASGKLGPVSRELRQQALNIQAGIQSFRGQLGVPPHFASKNDLYEAIKKGTMGEGDDFYDMVEKKMKTVPPHYVTEATADKGKK